MLTKAIPGSSGTCWCGSGGACEPLSPFVIPGCATWRRPGIHTPDRGYGFRARAHARPGMTASPLHIIECDGPQSERQVGLEMQRGEHFAHRRRGLGHNLGCADLGCCTVHNQKEKTWRKRRNRMSNVNHRGTGHTSFGSGNAINKKARAACYAILKNVCIALALTFLDSCPRVAFAGGQECIAAYYRTK